MGDDPRQRSQEELEKMLKTSEAKMQYWQDKIVHSQRSLEVNQYNEQRFYTCYMYWSGNVTALRYALGLRNNT